MPGLADTIVINLRGERFILACSTILAYPVSLLCEKFQNLNGKTNVIDIDRDARQFGLIRQLMLYKDRTRQRDIISANRKELDEDLEYYRLKHLSRYFDSPDLADLSSDSIDHRLPSLYKVQPSSNGPSLIIRVSAVELVGFEDGNIFNTAKYSTQIIDEDGGRIAMYFYLNSRELALEYLPTSKKHKSFHRLLFIFLSAIEKYDIKLKLLVGRSIFKKLCNQDLVP